MKLNIFIRVFCLKRYNIQYSNGKGIILWSYRLNNILHYLANRSINSITIVDWQFSPFTINTW